MAKITTPTRLLAEDVLRGQPFFNKLDASDQREFLEKGEGLAHAIYAGKTARLQVGKYLIELQTLLKYNFRAFIRDINYSEKTVYRIMDDYRTNQKLLPISVQPYAMAANFDIARKKYHAPTRKYASLNPFPANAGPDVAREWLNGLRTYLKQYDKSKMGSSQKDGTVEILPPEDIKKLLEKAWRFGRARFEELPNNSRTRASWIRDLFGYHLWLLGVSGQQSFSPIKPPEEFLTRRGRPKEEAP